MKQNNDNAYIYTVAYAKNSTYLYVYLHIYVNTHPHTYTLIRIHLLFDFDSDQAQGSDFESKRDKLSSFAECSIRILEVWDTKSPADWIPTHKPAELSKTKLKKFEHYSPYD